MLGLDSVDGNEMVIKLLAHVKPGMHFPGQRLLRKEVIQYFSEEGIHIPKPTLVKLDKELSKKNSLQVHFNVKFIKHPSSQSEGCFIFIMISHE